MYPQTLTNKYYELYRKVNTPKNLEAIIEKLKKDLEYHKDQEVISVSIMELVDNYITEIEYKHLDDINKKYI
ncbi:MAG: hypothetical protein PHR29_05185 [Acholeplasmataceae bacterium]|nr:hypothetical protein [Acholeplasmataceae bacterium]